MARKLIQLFLLQVYLSDGIQPQRHRCTHPSACGNAGCSGLSGKCLSLDMQVRDGNEVSGGSESWQLAWPAAASRSWPPHRRCCDCPASRARPRRIVRSRSYCFLNGSRLRRAQLSQPFNSFAGMLPVVARRCTGVDRAQCHLQAPRPRTLSVQRCSQCIALVCFALQSPGLRRMHAPGQTLEQLCGRCRQGLL